MKDARIPRSRRGEPPTYDVVTPTPDQARLEELGRRQRRYFRVMVPCILLVSVGFFGFFLPMPIRLVALAIAAFMPPIAAIVGNN
jgi:hypothetical protein